MFVVHILRAYSHLDGQPEVGRSSSQLTHIAEARFESGRAWKRASACYRQLRSSVIEGSAGPLAISHRGYSEGVVAGRLREVRALRGETAVKGQRLSCVIG
jgi:hypothetical protein